MSWLPIAALLATGRPAAHPVAVRGGETLGHGCFAATVAGVARRLAGAPGQTAVLLADDTWRFAAALLGALHAGRPVVLPPHRAMVSAAAAGQQASAVLDDAWVAATAPVDAALAPLDPARCIVAFFTSGSTGAPKLVPRSLAGLQAELDMFEQLWGAGSGCGPVRATVSHQHLYGLTFKVLWPLAAGRPFATETHDTWEAALPLIDEATMLVSSPAHLTRMAGLPALPDGRRPARVFSAGAPLPLAASLQAEALLGVAPTEIFGSTETGAIATRTKGGPATPWHPLPGVVLRREPDGRLALRSPAVDGGGWRRTDDLVEETDRGFRFLGRADRLTKIEGKRVALPSLEQALEASPWAAAAAVLVLPGDRPRLAAVVVPSDAGREKLAELGAFRFGRMLCGLLAATHEPAALPRRWRFVEALPAAHLGKRNDAALQALFADRS